MWQVVVAGTLVVLIGLVLLIRQAGRAAKAQAKLNEAKKDQANRGNFDEAVEKWTAGGGLAGGMRRKPEQPPPVSES